MAAVWAFCVGVQAEDMGCWPSPSRALMRTTHHGLPNTSQGSAHGGVHFSRREPCYEGESFAFLNSSGVAAGISPGRVCTHPQAWLRLVTRCWPGDQMQTWAQPFYPKLQ